MCKKRAYSDLNDSRALKHIRNLKKRGYANLHVYPCPKCGRFHVGHIPGSPKMKDFFASDKKT